jgi:uncharacterized protein (DUF885 family)
MGLDLVARYRDEVAAAAHDDDIGAVLRSLRDEPGLRKETGEEILDYVSAAYGRADAALDRWFRPYPRVPCEIREIDPIQARGGIIGYYHPAPGDGSRPATLWVNTFQPAQRSLVGYEALAFHEGVPGHHLQNNVSRGTGLPEFRRYLKATAHSEGWGLYSERLADEMGLYSSATARLGMLTSALWRACRLVVDTGLHRLGWSRSRAVEYMRDNTALTAADIDNEVDRYLAAPGQALAYLVGGVRIEQLRTATRERLGAAFDIAEFHHRVLADGSVPLDTLEEILAGWTGFRPSATGGAPA